MGWRYAAAMDALKRSRWDALVADFVSFFDGLGNVESNEDAVSFTAQEAGTGLTLNRDGTSVSFMPLHEMGGRWELVTFDRANHEVVVEGDGFSYTYRVPPNLLSH